MPHLHFPHCHQKDTLLEKVSEDQRKHLEISVEEILCSQPKLWRICGKQINETLLFAGGYISNLPIDA